MKEKYKLRISHSEEYFEIERNKAKKEIIIEEMEAERKKHEKKQTMAI